MSLLINLILIYFKKSLKNIACTLHVKKRKKKKKTRFMIVYCGELSSNWKGPDNSVRSANHKGAHLHTRLTGVYNAFELKNLLPSELCEIIAGMNNLC